MKVLCVVLALVVSSSAIFFNCAYREVQWLAIGLNYQCYSEAFNVDSTQTVTAVSGVHVANKTAQDVYSLHIDNCTNLFYIPQGLLNVFPNLQGIYLEGCAVSSLNGSELDAYTRLTVFALELSPLDYVPGDLFANNPALVLVSFADNKIAEVGTNLLSGLNNLSQVYFEHNQCIDKNAPTPEEIPYLIAALEADCSGVVDCSDADCSGANERLKSAVLFSLVLSSLAYVGKYIWSN